MSPFQKNRDPYPSVSTANQKLDHGKLRQKFGFFARGSGPGSCPYPVFEFQRSGISNLERLHEKRQQLRGKISKVPESRVAIRRLDALGPGTLVSSYHVSKSRITIS